MDEIQMINTYNKIVGTVYGEVEIDANSSSTVDISSPINGITAVVTLKLKDDSDADNVIYKSEHSFSYEINDDGNQITIYNNSTAKATCVYTIIDLYLN